MPVYSLPFRSKLLTHPPDEYLVAFFRRLPMITLVSGGQSDWLRTTDITFLGDAQLAGAGCNGDSSARLYCWFFTGTSLTVGSIS